MTDRRLESETLTNSFLSHLPPGLDLSGTVERILLTEYGGIFATAAVAPDTIIFRDEKEVGRFQNTLETKQATIGPFQLTLQERAMDALLAAIEDTEKAGLTLSPRGPDSAARSYADTIELWASRVEPALVHWTSCGRMGADEATRIRRLRPADQVAEVFHHESHGIWFAKDLSKSIIYSVAPPGASQHLSLLAFDVAEFENPVVRKLLESHGWFQTVVSDLPHFTYLGRDREQLSALGLKLVHYRNQEFWVPDI